MHQDFVFGSEQPIKILDSTDYIYYTCHTQSKNCRNIGDLSFGEVEYPKRSLNLCPNDSHSFSISTCMNMKETTK